MKQYFHLLLVVAIFLSCSKQAELPPAPAAASGNALSANNIFNFSSYLDKAARSAEKTFGQHQDVIITRIEEEFMGNCRVQTVYYKTAKGRESTFMVVQSMNISASVKKTTIDCYGTCDCRERVILDSAGNPAAYECTCSQCKMEITTES